MGGSDLCFDLDMDIILVWWWDRKRSNVNFVLRMSDWLTISM